MLEPPLHLGIPLGDAPGLLPAAGSSRRGDLAASPSRGLVVDLVVDPLVASGGAEPRADLVVARDERLRLRGLPRHRLLGTLEAELARILVHDVMVGARAHGLDEMAQLRVALLDLSLLLRLPLPRLLRKHAPHSPGLLVADVKVGARTSRVTPLLVSRILLRQRRLFRRLALTGLLR